MFGKNFSYLIVAGIAAVTMTVAPASATTITTYSTLASWQAMTSGATFMDFENGSLAQFSGLGGGTAIAIQDTNQYSWMNFGTNKAAFINLNSPTTMPYIRIAPSSSVTAFALNIFSANPNALTFSVSVNSGTPFTVSTNAIGNPPGFIGVTSDTPITSIDLMLQNVASNSGAYEFVDNFRTAQADQTPEVATLLLIGSGLVGMMAIRKRRLLASTFPNTRIAQ